MNEEYKGFTIGYNPAFGYYIVGHEDWDYFPTPQAAKAEIDKRLAPRRGTDEEIIQH